MVTKLKFGRKVPMPSGVQIKHQILTLWLKDQRAKEAAEAAASVPATNAGPATHSR